MKLLTAPQEQALYIPDDDLEDSSCWKFEAMLSWIIRRLRTQSHEQPSLSEDDFKMLCLMFFMLPVTLQSFYCSLLYCKPPISSHSFYLLLRRWIQASHHSTCAQMTLKHKPDRHADLNIDSPLTHLLSHIPPSSYLGDVRQFQTELSHQVMPFRRGGKKEKKEGKKSTKIDDFSFLHSRPVVCNLLWHSTSSASLFNNYVHRGHKKGCSLVEYGGRWLFKEWILMTGGSRKALSHRQSSPALKST